MAVLHILKEVSQLSSHQIRKNKVPKSASKLVTATSLNSEKKQLMTTLKPKILLFNSSNTSTCPLYRMNAR